MKERRPPEESPGDHQGLGLYDDQALQEYVQRSGPARRAAERSAANEEFKFFGHRRRSINAFTTGCCNVYVNRGLLRESQLRGRARRCARPRNRPRHRAPPARRQTRGMLASCWRDGAAILTGSNAIGSARQHRRAGAWMQGYGRENEMEADRLGLKYMVKAGYNPESIGDVFDMFQAGEKFETPARARRRPRAAPLSRRVLEPSEPGSARGPGRQGRRQHRQERRPAAGSTPRRIPDARSTASPTARARRRASCATTASITRTWASRWRSRAAGRSRTCATACWRSRRKKDAVMQVTIDAKPEKQAPREFLLTQAAGRHR